MGCLCRCGSAAESGSPRVRLWCCLSSAGPRARPLAGGRTWLALPTPHPTPVLHPSTHHVFLSFSTGQEEILGGGSHPVLVRAPSQARLCDLRHDSFLLIGLVPRVKLDNNTCPADLSRFFQGSNDVMYVKTL